MHRNQRTGTIFLKIVSFPIRIPKHLDAESNFPQNAAWDRDAGAMLAPFHKRGYTAEPIDEGLMKVEKALRPA